MPQLIPSGDKPSALLESIVTGLIESTGRGDVEWEHTDLRGRWVTSTLQNAIVILEEDQLTQDLTITVQSLEGKEIIAHSTSSQKFYKAGWPDLGFGPLGDDLRKLWGLVSQTEEERVDVLRLLLGELQPGDES